MIEDISVLSPRVGETISQLKGTPELYSEWNLKHHKVLRDTHDPRKMRKLVFLPDKEGKTRTIAIFDYWSQAALKPLHSEVNAILRTIKADCTFDQNGFKEAVLSNKKFFCYDLKNATDRLPVLLQADIVRVLKTSKYAVA